MQSYEARGLAVMLGTDHISEVPPIVAQTRKATPRRSHRRTTWGTTKRSPPLHAAVRRNAFREHTIVFSTRQFLPTIVAQNCRVIYRRSLEIEPTISHKISQTPRFAIGSGRCWTTWFGTATWMLFRRTFLFRVLVSQQERAIRGVARLCDQCAAALLFGR